jgi:hypothetical protein
MRNRLACIPLVLLCSPAWAQNEPNLAAVLERLDRLEQQNRALAAEVADLKRQLAGTPKLEERLEVQERRTEELADTKVQTSQRLPISVTGMLLFNAFSNGSFNGTSENPTTASLNPVPRTAGGTVRQSILGLRFRSPTTVWGAEVNGSLFMDFFAGQTTNGDRLVSGNLNRLMRLRLATVSLDWGSTSLVVGQDKPIISPREPNSLSHVGVSPLTNAGNPWLWQPQARVEQRFTLGTKTDVRAQVGVFQTVEGGGAQVPEPFSSTVESSRPGLEARVAFHHGFANGGHIEFAPSIHASTTHVAATSVPSRIYGIDWSLAPYERFAFTGMYYRGYNTSPLGTIRQGFQVLGPGRAVAVHSNGGWAQFSYEATPRLTLNLFGGQHDDRDRDLRANAIGKNFAYAGNAQYRLAPNVILGFETMQIRTTYVGPGLRRNNHYDLALAYQF